MKKTAGSMVTTGIPSIFLVFSVLCLVILSLLSVGTSRSDLRLSEISMQNATAYYESCSYATELCLMTEAVINSGQPAGSDYGSVPSAVEEFLDEEIEEVKASGELALPGLQSYTWNPDGNRLSLTIPYTERLALLVDLSFSFHPSSSSWETSILRWQSIQIGSWTPDMHQNVFLPSDEGFFTGDAQSGKR